MLEGVSVWRTYKLLREQHLRPKEEILTKVVPKINTILTVVVQVHFVQVLIKRKVRTKRSSYVILHCINSNLILN